MHLYESFDDCMDAPIADAPPASSETLILILAAKINDAVLTAVGSDMPLSLAIMVAQATTVKLYENAEDDVLDTISEESFEDHCLTISDSLLPNPFKTALH